MGGDAADDDDAAGLTTTINVLSVTLGDAGDDTIWSPGETLGLFLVVRDLGPLDHTNYPEVVLETSTAGVTVQNPVHTFFAIVQGQDLEAFYFVDAAASAALGPVTFTAWVRNRVEDCGDEFNPCIESEPFTFMAVLE